MDAYLGHECTLLAMVTAGSRAVIAESLQVVGCIGFLGLLQTIEFGKLPLQFWHLVLLPYSLLTN